MSTIILKNNDKLLNNKFIKYVIPSVISMWVSALYVMVDAMFVSKGVGPDALAAVNIAMPYTNFVFALSVLFSIGSSAVISMELGNKDSKNANKYFSMTVIGLIIISLILTFLSLVFLDEIALFLGATENIMPMVKSYLGIIVLFITFYIATYALEVLVKADGYPHLSTIGVLISAITNVVLDYVFVLKFNWGVEGAALATGLARAFSFVFFMVHFLSKRSNLKFCKFKFELGFFKRTTAIGISDCTTELSIGVIILLFNQSILKYLGESALVSYSIISYVNTLVLSTMLGISQGIQPLCSYYHGTGDKKSIKYLLSLSLKVVLVCSIIIYLGCNLFSDFIVLMFIDKIDMNLFNYSISIFKVFSISFLLLGFNIVTSGFLASLERTFEAGVISLGRGLFVVSLSVGLMIYLFGGEGIWIATIVSELTVLCMSITLLRRFLRNFNNSDLDLSNECSQVKAS